MVNAKPFVIEYPQRWVLTGYEFTSEKGEIFKSVKEFKERANTGDYVANAIIFCPDCRAGNRREIWGFRNSNSTKKTKVRGQCPNCGEKLTLSYYAEFDCPELVCGKNEPLKYLVHAGGSNPASVPRALKWWPVADDKLAIETVVDLFFARTMYGKYWLHHEYLRHRFIFNLRTGQCYMMRGIDKDGKPSKFSGQKHRLQNYTFHFMHSVPERMRHDFVRVVLDALKEYKGIDYLVEALDGSAYAPNEERFTVAGYEIDLSRISFLNYFSDMHREDMADMLELSHNFYDRGVRKIYPRLVDLSSKGEVEWLPKYMQKPSIRRRLRKRALGYWLYKWMHTCGVKDVNIMNNVFDALVNKKPAKANSRTWGNNKRPFASAILRVCVDKSKHEFVRWAIKNRNAESVCQLLLNILDADQNYLLTDSARMYGLLPEQVRPERSVGNLKEIHDNLVVLDRKWRFGNRVIQYADVEKALEIDCGEYSFRLAKDTDTLYDIGKQMGICVGSYSREALAKSCTIMTMQKADKYIACIELRMSKKQAHIVQLKSKFNHTVSEIEPIVQWVGLTGVDPNCRDYQNAIEHKHGNFDYDERDYHVENPRFVNGVDVAAEDDGELDWGGPLFANRPFAPALPF